jgi:hypothetical protein
VTTLIQNLIALGVAVGGVSIAAIFSRRVRLTLLELVGKYHPEPEPHLEVHITHTRVVSGGHFDPNDQPLVEMTWL